MTIERIRSDGMEQISEIISPGTNIKLPKNGLAHDRNYYNEWHLRIEDLDRVTLFFFGQGVPDHRWTLTRENINNLGELTFYEPGDIKLSYKWRLSTEEETILYQNTPRTNIPRASYR